MAAETSCKEKLKKNGKDKVLFLDEEMHFLMLVWSNPCSYSELLRPSQ